MTFRGVLLCVAVLCSALPSTALQTPSVVAAPNARQATPPRSASPDPQVWQAWRQRVRAEIETRRSALAHADNASNNASSGIIETVAGAAPSECQRDASGQLFDSGDNLGRRDKWRAASDGVADSHSVATPRQMRHSGGMELRFRNLLGPCQWPVGKSIVEVLAEAFTETIQTLPPR